MGFFREVHSVRHMSRPGSAGAGAPQNLGIWGNGGKKRYTLRLLQLRAAHFFTHPNQPWRLPLDPSLYTMGAYDDSLGYEIRPVASVPNYRQFDADWFMVIVGAIRCGHHPGIRILLGVSYGRNVPQRSCSEHFVLLHGKPGRGLRERVHGISLFRWTISIFAEIFFQPMVTFWGRLPLHLQD
jgi:hypothetical protein